MTRVGTTDVVPSSESPDPAPSDRRPTVRLVVASTLVLLVVVAAVGSGAGVWTGAVALGLALALTAIGVYITFRVLDFPDLTVEASFAGGAAITSQLLTNGRPSLLSIPLAFSIGALFGALTAALHLALKINPLLASILTVTAGFTINLRLQGSANVSLLGVDTIYSGALDPVRNALDSWFGETGVQVHRNVVTALVGGIVAAIVVVALQRFFRTEVGIGLRATGANQQMSRAQGVDTRLYLAGGVALSNGLVGVSGALVSQHQGFADVSSGTGLIIAGLAAVILGQVLFAGSTTPIWRQLAAVVLGMVVFRGAIALALSTDVDLPLLEPWRLAPTDVRLVTAAIVIVLLAVPRIRARRRGGRPA